MHLQTESNHSTKTTKNNNESIPETTQKRPTDKNTFVFHFHIPHTKNIHREQ